MRGDADTRTRALREHPGKVTTAEGVPIIPITAPAAAAAPAGRGVASPEGLGLAAGIFFAGFTALPLMLNSKMMLTDIFSPFAEADLFAGSAVASYVGAMSLANSAGRLTIGPLSDAVSLRAAYALCGLQIPLVLALPSIAAAAPADPATAAAAWKAATCAIRAGQE